MTAKQTAKRIGVSALLALAVLAVLGGLAGLWLIASEPALAQTRARVLIEIDDSDSVVSPGDDLDVHVWVRYGLATADTYSMRFFHAANGPVVIDPGTERSVEPQKPDLTGTLIYLASVRLVVPLGSPVGTATLSAWVDVRDADPLDLGTATLTIGDAGDPVGSARISSTIVEFAETGTRSSTSLRTLETAYLKLETLNSRGRLTNDSDVQSIIITATGGIVSRRDPGTTEANWEQSDHFLQYSDEQTDELRQADALTEFTVKPLDRQPVHIDVYATVIGADASVRSSILAVNFAGQADSLTIGAPSGTLAARHGSVRIPVSGLDSDSNRDNLGTSSVLAEITEGPEDADLAMLSLGKSSCTSSQRDCELGDVILLITSTKREGEQAEHGTYAIEVKLREDEEETVYTTVVQVVGEPVTMTLELLDGVNPAVRSIFTTTGRGNYVYGAGEQEQLIVASTQAVYAAVTLRDVDGVLVSDTSTSVSGDGVRFQIVGALTVTLFSTREVEIIDGVAYIRFLVTGEEGSALIIPTSRDLEQIASIVAREKSRFGLDGLIKVQADDYTTWIGANTVRISEIYGLLQARGITSVLLWLSGEERWLRYAVVQDAAVPGSLDFLITYGDTLWLSG